MLTQAPTKALVMIIRGYQRVSRYTPAMCRYTPTCSEYMAQSLEKHGVMKGLWLGTKRICRCHPWGGHGEDPVPD